MDLSKIQTWIIYIKPKHYAMPPSLPQHMFQPIYLGTQPKTNMERKENEHYIDAVTLEVEEVRRQTQLYPYNFSAEVSKQNKGKRHSISSHNLGKFYRLFSLFCYDLPKIWEHKISLLNRF